MLNGEFVLKTTEGDVHLRLTKLVFYKFEKSRGVSFLTPFLTTDGEKTKLNPGELFNSDLQIDLAHKAQIGTKHSLEKLLEISDSEELSKFLQFAIEQYVDMRGLSAKEDHPQ